MKRSCAKIHLGALLGFFGSNLLWEISQKPFLGLAMNPVFSCMVRKLVFFLKDDVRLEPIISGRGKLCRLMATMGVARGVGDHGLIVKSSCVNCKDFLSCQPEIRTYDLTQLSRDGKNNEYLIMGSDGLWDVVSNHQCHDIVTSHLTGKGKNGFMSKVTLLTLAISSSVYSVNISSCY